MKADFAWASHAVLVVRQWLTLVSHGSGAVDKVVQDTPRQRCAAARRSRGMPLVCVRDCKMHAQHVCLAGHAAKAGGPQRGSQCSCQLRGYHKFGIARQASVHDLLDTLLRKLMATGWLCSTCHLPSPFCTLRTLEAGFVG